MSRGKIKDPSGAVISGAKVEFQSKGFDKTLTTKEIGVCEADSLSATTPRFAQSPGFRPYRRPLFRVKSAAAISFDATLPVQPTCDMVMVNSAGIPPTPEEWAAAKRDLCLHEDFFPVPSRDGVPFQLYIRYVKHSALGGRR
jgi:hypothetical protein